MLQNIMYNVEFTQVIGLSSSLSDYNRNKNSELKVKVAYIYKQQNKLHQTMQQNNEVHNIDKSRLF